MLKEIKKKIVDSEEKFSDTIVLILCKFFDLILNNKRKNKMKTSSVLILETDNEKNKIFELTFKGNVGRCRITKSVAEFCDLLFPTQWDYIFLQHDLFNEPSQSNSPESGYNALRMILEQYQFRDQITRIIIHTGNVTGAKNMLEMSYVADFDRIQHVIFNTAEFKAEILKIKRELDVI